MALYSNLPISNQSNVKNFSGELFPTVKVSHRAPFGLYRFHCKPQVAVKKRFKKSAQLGLTTWAPYGLFHFHCSPRESSENTLRLNPFTGARDGKPPSGGQRAVVDDDARGPVHGVGRERLAAQGRDDRHPDGQARVVGLKRHAALFAKVQRQLSFQVGVEIHKDWPSNHSGIRSSYTTFIVKPNLPLEILSL